MDSDDYRIDNLGSTEALVRRINERSDDFEKAVLFPPGGQFVKQGIATSGVIDEFAMAFHLASGRKHVIFGQDVEAVLNDGILNRMRIKIELQKFN